jgi:fatty-acyl-CoA synthase
MAALVVAPDLRCRDLGANSRQSAAYARPVFLRLQPEMEITGTFKQRKVELVKKASIPARSPIRSIDGR